MLLLLTLLWIGLAGWILLFVWLLRNAIGHPTVSAQMDFPLQDRPRVSILIPARNEAHNLVTTLPRFLGQNYENYEVILVDDASTDGTSKVAEQVAAAHPGRLRVIRVTELPPGWVGKTHALHVGFQAARGEWVLATDADIVFHSKALRAGLWLAQQQRADLVSIYPFLECVSFWEKVVLPGFGLLLSAMFPVRWINDPRSTAALASGGYILLRRAVWEGLGGYESIRAEMIDDLNTARLVKHSGHRIFVTASKDLLRTRMYHNFREIWEGLRKNAFAGHRFSIPKMVATTGVYLLANLLPLACLLFYAWSSASNRTDVPPAIFALSLAQYGVAVLLHLPLIAHLRINLGYALLAPLGAILYAAICIDSMARTLLGKGVSWKLRQYGKPRVAPEN